jgi:hypothetical protein
VEVIEGKEREGFWQRGASLGLLLSLKSNRIGQREGCLSIVSRATERGDRVDLLLVSLHRGERKEKGEE